MNTYKERMQKRINLVTFAAVAVAIIYMVLTVYRDQLPALPGFIKGFHIGVFTGLEVIAAWYLGKCIRARKNETEMKKMFIAESDERSGLIIRKASTIGISVVLAGLAVATIVSGFFNVTVFFTLMASLIFVSIVFYALWIYYARIL